MMRPHDYTPVFLHAFYFITLPQTVSHVISPSSPLYGLTSADLFERDCELIVVMEATDASTGAPFQAQKSYLPSDVHYGFRFQRCVLRDVITGRRSVNFSLFDELVDWEAWRSRSEARRGGSCDTSPMGTAHREHRGLEMVAELDLEKELEGGEMPPRRLEAEGPWE